MANGSKVIYLERQGDTQSFTVRRVEGLITPLPGDVLDAKTVKELLDAGRVRIVIDATPPAAVKGARNRRRRR